jgi:hypothetical protein
VLIPDPFEGIPEVIYLEEKDNRLDEVVVTGKPTFTEEQKMKAFREQFLGRTKAGQSCRILNENVIRLIYDPEANKLHGYADAPIEIENSYLGYFIRWELIKFTLSLYQKTKSLDNSNADSITITGVAFFKETETDDFISHRREIAYDISQRHFFQLLAEGTINKSDFRIFKNDGIKRKMLRQAMPASQWFEKTDNSPDSQVTTMALNPNQKDSAGTTSILVAQLSLSLSSYLTANTDISNYESVNFSKLYFFTDTFNIDGYGNTSLLENLSTTGIMGSQRIGDMLPFNYLPSRKRQPADNWWDEASRKK